MVTPTAQAKIKAVKAAPIADKEKNGLLDRLLRNSAKALNETSAVES